MFVVVVVLGMLFAGVAAPAAAQEAAVGAQVFAKSCRGCHGEGGSGGIGPALRGGSLTVDAVSQRLTEKRPGSMMPQFSNILNQDQRQQVAAYVASLQAAAMRSAVLPRPNPMDPLTLAGDAKAGETLFFRGIQTHSCVVCHSVNGRGGKVGPDLAPRVGALSAKQVFDRIVVVPHRSSDRDFAPTRVQTKGGELITGIVESETADALRIYDTSYLPPRLVTIPRHDLVSKSAVSNTTVMPKDYASRFTLQQLLDLVAFLKSAGRPTPLVVKLSDVMQ